VRFYLGTHLPSFLRRTEAPLFISRRRLAKRKTVPRAIGPWALDSGGFTELSTHGHWTITPERYVEEARRWEAEIGNLQWAAPQDWMCEPDIIHGGGPGNFPGTGLSVAEHQRRTVENYLRLGDLAPGFPWTPVLQGWSLWEYLDHVEQYRRAGVHLEAFPLVGVGSVCRRQSKDLPMVTVLIRELWAMGLKLHAFGFKLTGLPATSGWLESSDSMAWSYRARRGRVRLPECTHRARTCAHCLRWALRWRGQVLKAIGRPFQERLW
jgi:hypothetical protein